MPASDPTSHPPASPAHSDQAVDQRYSQAAEKAEAALCCPVSYNTKYLKAIPEEILSKDYGCGDPSTLVNKGETVLDLGSGGGKLCFIAAQVVGASGQVIGVDSNQKMLDLARKYQNEVAEKIGFDNVQFRCGRIQDLTLDLELLASQLASRQISSVEDLLQLRNLEAELRLARPLVPDSSIDCVISNCVLNLVHPDQRRQLLSEIHRVLRIGGRAAISDIVSDEDVPKSMQDDPELWSGCVSGAWREDLFLDAFAEAGFCGLQIHKLETKPWRTVRGIEFRAMTVVAYKPDDAKCLERNQAVIYRGPFKGVLDEAGNIYHRGVRMAVCDRTFRSFQQPPYGGHFIGIEPIEEVLTGNATEFDCGRVRRRTAQETKGKNYQLNQLNQQPCCDDDNCC